MRIKRRLVLLLASVLVLPTGVMTGCASKGGTTVYDGEEQVLAVLNRATIDKLKLEEEGHRAYLDIVFDEAAGIISSFSDCSEEEAKELIAENEYEIYTEFDSAMYEAIKNSYQEYEQDELEFGCAVTDLQGNLIAAYSEAYEEDEYENCASMQTAPYSSFKPISTYTPALEAGIISWSSMYSDSPVKQLETSDGNTVDWPANSTGTYKNEEVTVTTAIKESLNTIAVKCLQDYGVIESVAFMKDRLGIELDYEESKLNLSGEDEVIGNIALGYLQDGVSPVDMAGYYQIFANGGSYVEPTAVVKICAEDGSVIYEKEKELTQAILPETAFVMNHLLQEVVSIDGTGEQAITENVMVGGKTGTGDNGNWFVGFTPEYSVAVWHGKQIAGNQAPDFFSNIVANADCNPELSFPECGTVKEAVYCKQSGMLLSDGCQEIDRGYYLSVNLPGICDMH